MSVVDAELMVGLLTQAAVSGAGSFEVRLVPGADGALRRHFVFVFDGLRELVEGLCREHEGRVLLSPGLEGLDDVVPDRGVLEEAPRLVHDEDLKGRRDCRVVDDVIGPVEDVEEKGLDDLGVLIHTLEIEALEAAKAQSVLGVVEYRLVLPALDPFREAVRERLREKRRERPETTDAGIASNSMNCNAPSIEASGFLMSVVACLNTGLVAMTYEPLAPSAVSRSTCVVLLATWYFFTA